MSLCRQEKVLYNFDKVFLKNTRESKKSQRCLSYALIWTHLSTNQSARSISDRRDLCSQGIYQLLQYSELWPKSPLHKFESTNRRGRNLHALFIGLSNYDWTSPSIHTWRIKFDCSLRNSVNVCNDPFFVKKTNLNIQKILVTKINKTIITNDIEK